MADRDAEQIERTNDWSALVERAVGGDAVAYGRLTRLVTGYLARWRAYDFRPDWEDIVQEVLVSTVTAHREGRIENDAAFQAFVRQATRFKFIDRIRARKRVAEERVREDGSSSEPSESEALWPPDSSVEADGAELRLTLRAALERLSDREREAVMEVHLRGRTYEEAAAVTGMPLGTLKHALKTGLGRLRRALEGSR